MAVRNESKIQVEGSVSGTSGKGGRFKDIALEKCFTRNDSANERRKQREIARSRNEVFVIRRSIRFFGVKCSQAKNVIQIEHVT